MEDNVVVAVGSRNIFGRFVATGNAKEPESGDKNKF